MFNLGKRTGGKPDAAPDPKWARNAKGRFHRFIHLDPEEEGLSGISGVFVIWHDGVRPEWVMVAKSGNLAFDLHKLAQDKDLMDYEARGGLFLTWSLIKPGSQEGVVRFLANTLDPVLEGLGFPGKGISPIPVVLPNVG